jgi:uncharacterized Tic20 family protein
MEKKSPLELRASSTTFDNSSKKDQSPFVDYAGKQALNFQITLVIGYVVAFLLCFLCIGYLLLPALFIVQLVFGILASVATNKGEAYRYPIAIPFLG